MQITQPDNGVFLTFSVRGFRNAQGDMLLNGLAIAPTANGTMMTESIERVEVLRCPYALLSGAVPGGSVGGMVNLIPKRWRRAVNRTYRPIHFQYATRWAPGYRPALLVALGGYAVSLDSIVCFFVRRFHVRNSNARRMLIRVNPFVRAGADDISCRGPIAQNDFIAGRHVLRSLSFSFVDDCEDHSASPVYGETTPDRCN